MSLSEKNKSPVADAAALSDELIDEKSLRPNSLNEYVGQPALKKQLATYLTSAKMRGAALDHVLLYGPPGLGKTTLAQIIAAELEVSIRVTAGPVLEKAGDLVALLTQLKANDVLFIDEIHRLPPVLEEVLYPAMEDGKIDILIGTGEQARAITVPLPPFTLVGATTKAGSLTGPLRDRFGITGRLEYYSLEDLSAIVKRSAGLIGMDMPSEACLELAKRSRGTPRIANRILRRVRDFALVHGSAKGVATLDDTKGALELVGVNEAGLDHADCLLLRTLRDKFKGGPVGLDTLASAIGESSGTVESNIEPYLIQEGFLLRTPRGRVITEQGIAALN